jgi:hypothetical protein
MDPLRQRIGILLIVGILCMLSTSGVIIAFRYLGDMEVHLYVSNQSVYDDPARIEVSMDGEAVFDGDCAYLTSHNWILTEFGSDKGSHEIVARSSHYNETALTIFSSYEDVWIVVDYFNQGFGGGRFEFSVMHKEPSFG